jgi:CheY-like chemotaxis protein
MPATILCIDDEEPGLQTRKRLLESAGHHVLTASSGQEGIRIFKAERVDAVILDYWMSGMNGLAVAHELKRLERTVPVIMLSAYVSLPGEFLGIADVWICKGEVEPDDFLSAVAQLLKDVR